MGETRPREGPPLDEQMKGGLIQSHRRGDIDNPNGKGRTKEEKNGGAWRVSMHSRTGVPRRTFVSEKG